MDVNKILVFLILNKLLKGSSNTNMPETSSDSNVVKSPMKKAKKNKKEKKDIAGSVASDVPAKVQPSVVSSTASTPSTDAPVHKTKAKKDKNNKTKQMTKQSTTESMQSIESQKEIEPAKECPFQAVFETFTANKSKKQRKTKKVTKEDSSEELPIQTERKVIDVEIKPKDNKEKRSKAEKKKLAANCSDIDDKSQVWAELIGSDSESFFFVHFVLRITNMVAPLRDDFSVRMKSFYSDGLLELPLIPCPQRTRWKAVCSLYVV